MTRSEKPKAPNTSKNYQPHQYRHPCTWPGCDQRFVSPHNLNQHIRERHTGERPYVCFCGKNFYRQYGLNRHESEVHGIENGIGKGRRKKRAKAEAEKIEKDVPEEMISDLDGMLEGFEDLSGLPNQMLSDFDMTFSNPDWTAADAYGLSNAEFAVEQRAQYSQHLERGEVFDQTMILPHIARSVSSQLQPGSNQGAYHYAFAPAPLTTDHDPTTTLQSHPDLELDYEVDAKCDFCSVDFGDLDTVLVHYHTHHGLPNVPPCICRMCNSMSVPPSDRPANDEAVGPAYRIGDVAEDALSGADVLNDDLWTQLDAWLQRIRRLDDHGS